jgi:hypothetical protein
VKSNAAARERRDVGDLSANVRKTPRSGLKRRRATVRAVGAVAALKIERSSFTATKHFL